MALIKNEFDSAAELNAVFAEKIANLLAAGIAENGKASLLVSGGRTPKPMFAELSQKDIAWDKVKISLADERWVQPDHEASNEKLVRENLLVNKAAAAEFVSMVCSDADAVDAQREIAGRINTMKQPFDVLILGMGEDGHTASLFPCSEQIDEGLQLPNHHAVIAVTPTTAPHQRMSLTLARLLQSNNIFLHLVGEGKKDTLAAVESSDNAREMPIRAVIANTDVNLMWAP